MPIRALSPGPVIRAAIRLHHVVNASFRQAAMERGAGQLPLPQFLLLSPKHHLTAIIFTMCIVS